MLLATAVGPSTSRSASAALGCEFVFGFAALHDMLPDVVGDCLEDQSYNLANGDALQRTTGGLLVWRKADNFTAFTDGDRSWVNGPFGLQTRLNSESFAWEGGGSAAAAPSAGASAGSGADAQSSAANGGAGAPAPGSDEEQQAMRLAATRLVASFLAQFNGDCFARVVSLGDAGLYASALQDVRIVIAPQLRNGDGARLQGRYRPVNIDPRDLNFSPTIELLRDPRGVSPGADPDKYVTTLWHELSHRLEDRGGDPDRDTDWNERHTEYMEAMVGVLGAVAQFEQTIQAGRPTEAARQWSIAKRKYELGSSNLTYPHLPEADQAQLQQWSGFRVVLEDVEALYRAGGCDFAIPDGVFSPLTAGGAATSTPTPTATPRPQPPTATPTPTPQPPTPTRTPQPPTPTRTTAPVGAAPTITPLPTFPPTPTPPVFVLLLDVSNGGLYIGTEDSLRGVKACRFAGGGLCSPSSPNVTYRRLAGPLPGPTEALAALGQNLTECHYFPLGVGWKGRWRGGDWYGLWEGSVAAALTNCRKT